MFAHRHQNLVVELTRIMAVAVALLMLTVLTVSRSEAAFSATTDNTAIAFATGSVAISDDDGGTALFNVAAMSPGTSEVKCIEVTYDGSAVPADVKLFGTSAGTLAPYLDVDIAIGTVGTFASCAGFTGTSIYNGTLDGFSTTHVDWSNGLASFSPAATGESRVFQFTVDVQNVTAAQDKTASASFTWEVQDN